MSDIQPNESWQPASADNGDKGESFDEELFDGLIDRPQEREGLPPGYRMRHDAHYVDQLTQPAAPPIRMLATADIDGVRPIAGPELAPLVASIARFGLLQPLLVRRRNGRYELIAGARRLAAAAAAGLREVPCVLHEADESEARALSEATNTRAAREDREAAALQLTRAAVKPAALADLGRHLDAIASCINLASAGSRSLRERVAMQLIRLEVQRATWLSAGLAVLIEDPAVARTQVQLSELLHRVADAMRPECSLDGFEVRVAVAHTMPLVHGDQQLLAVAFGAAIAATHALTAPVPGAPVHCTAHLRADHAAVVVEIAQDAVTLPASHLARFFDLDWNERPGGYEAAIGVVAARRIVELHAGTLEALTGVDAGSRLRFELPTGRQRQV